MAKERSGSESRSPNRGRRNRAPSSASGPASAAAPDLPAKAPSTSGGQSIQSRVDCREREIVKKGRQTTDSTNERMNLQASRGLQAGLPQSQLLASLSSGSFLLYYFISHYLHEWAALQLSGVLRHLQPHKGRGGRTMIG